MEEEPTKELPGGSPFEQRVLQQLSAIRSALAAFDRHLTAIDSRLMAVDSRLMGVERHLTAVDSRLTAVESRLMGVERHLTAVDSRLTAVETRLTTLEEKVDARLRETRPIWEAVQLELKRLHTKFDNVIQDLYETRTDVRLLDKRFTELEHAGRT